MLRATGVYRAKLRKSHGSHLMGRVGKTTVVKKVQRNLVRSADGDLVKGMGSHRVIASTGLKESITEMEHPAVWIWYPWRRKPEPPSPGLPCPNALKNLHGAVYTELSPQQKQKQEEMHFGVDILPTREAQHEARHPFLAKVLQDLTGHSKGFPFWFKKYPTRRHAYATRFNIPAEMLEGYPEEVKRAVSRGMMTLREKRNAQKAMYAEKYAEHDLDVNSPAVVTVQQALVVRDLRNHMLTNPHNNIAKMLLAKKEQSLLRSLRRLRKLDFKKYWEIVRDHDVSDLMQPSNAVSYRWGAYWHYDWNNGLAISTDVKDWMDTRGLAGCVETGRSRAEVARDLGLSYTRPLNDRERKQLSDTARYHERLLKFKAEHPEEAREKERRDFVRKFTGMFQRLSWKSTAPDFASRYRAAVGTRFLRWRSARHGPK